MLMSLNHFDEYVRGTGRFLEVFTDHNPLVFLHRMKNANQRLMRWCLLLQDYDLVIKHVGGRDNVFFPSCRCFELWLLCDGFVIVVVILGQVYSDWINIICIEILRYSLYQNKSLILFTVSLQEFTCFHWKQVKRRNSVYTCCHSCM